MAALKGNPGCGCIDETQSILDAIHNSSLTGDEPSNHISHRSCQLPEKFGNGEGMQATPNLCVPMTYGSSKCIQVGSRRGSDCSDTLDSFTNCGLLREQARLLDGSSLPSRRFEPKRTGLLFSSLVLRGCQVLRQIIERSNLPKRVLRLYVGNRSLL